MKLSDFKIVFYVILLALCLVFTVSAYDYECYQSIATDVSCGGISCTPSWSCSSFSGYCNNGRKECFAVNDSNNCSISFGGSLSDYSRSCSSSGGGGSVASNVPMAAPAQVQEQKGILVQQSAIGSSSVAMLFQSYLVKFGLGSQGYGSDL